MLFKQITQKTLQLVMRVQKNNKNLSPLKNNILLYRKYRWVTELLKLDTSLRCLRIILGLSSNLTFLGWTTMS
jgi:hypothetical protein